MTIPAAYSSVRSLPVIVTPTSQKESSTSGMPRPPKPYPTQYWPEPASATSLSASAGSAYQPRGEQAAPLNLGPLEGERHDRQHGEQRRRDEWSPGLKRRAAVGDRSRIRAGDARIRDVHAASSSCAPGSAGIESVTVVPEPS